jgi:BASS family bile acid:Na+ symporter
MDFSQALGPIVLFSLMIVVGLQLTPEDFRRVFANRRAVVGGTLAQLAFLPLLTWGVVSLFGLSPAMSAGAVLLSAAPGAALSNVMTAVSRAHVALSVTLTAVSSVLAAVTLPALTAIGMRVFLEDSARVEVPLAHLVGQLVMFLLIPILLGMLVRAKRPDSALRYASWANRFALVAIVLLTFMSAASGSAALPPGSEFVRAIAAAVVWTFAAMAIGWGVALLLGLDANDRFTFLIEFSARNIALAFIIATASLGRLDLALFSGAYSMTGFPLVMAASALRGRYAKSPALLAPREGLEPPT